MLATPAQPLQHTIFSCHPRKCACLSGQLKPFIRWPQGYSAGKNIVPQLWQTANRFLPCPHHYAPWIRLQVLLPLSCVAPSARIPKRPNEKITILAGRSHLRRKGQSGLTPDMPQAATVRPHSVAWQRLAPVGAA